MYVAVRLRNVANPNPKKIPIQTRRSSKSKENLNQLHKKFKSIDNLNPNAKKIFGKCAKATGDNAVLTYACCCPKHPQIMPTTYLNDAQNIPKKAQMTPKTYPNPNDLLQGVHIHPKAINIHGFTERNEFKYTTSVILGNTCRLIEQEN